MIAEVTPAVNTATVMIEALGRLRSAIGYGIRKIKSRLDRQWPLQRSRTVLCNGNADIGKDDYAFLRAL